MNQLSLLIELNENKIKDKIKDGECILIMSKMFGVVNKPIFDSNVFKVGEPIYITDYKLCVEYSAIIVSISPMSLEVLYYDNKTDKAVFSRVDIDKFVNGEFEIEGLVKLNLKESYEIKNSILKDNKVVDVDLNGMSIEEFTSKDSECGANDVNHISDVVNSINNVSTNIDSIDENIHSNVVDNCDDNDSVVGDNSVDNPSIYSASNNNIDNGDDTNNYSSVDHSIKSNWSLSPSVSVRGIKDEEDCLDDLEKERDILEKERNLELAGREESGNLDLVERERDLASVNESIKSVTEVGSKKDSFSKFIPKSFKKNK